MQYLKERQRERERERERTLISTEENRLEKKNKIPIVWLWLASTCTWPYIKIAKHPLSWWMLIFQKSHVSLDNNDRSSKAE
jgi:hypothetical protein